MKMEGEKGDKGGLILYCQVALEVDELLRLYGGRIRSLRDKSV